MKAKGIITIVVMVVIVIIGLTFWYAQTSEETNTNTTTNTNTAANTNAVTNNYMDVDVNQAYNLTLPNSDPLTVILDVSPNYDQGHIVSAVNYYVGDGSLDAAIPTLEKNYPYLVYCHVNSASISGAQKLIDAGFPTVYRLVGNYAAWETAGYPISIPLEAVGTVTGDVKADVSYFNGTFTHAVMADIPEPADGKFYEGWLVQGTDFFSTGQLDNIGTIDNPYFTLLYTSTEDLRAYNKVVVTEETENLGLDGNPETHIFEGAF